MNNNVPPKIHEIVRKALKEDIENFTITVQDPNKKGEGYLGQIFFISLKDKDNGKQLNFVVKQAFSEKSIREFSPIREIFVNENYFYTKVWPKFLKFQEAVPVANRFVHVAKCSATSSQENYERLVLENFKPQGFVIHDKKKALTKDQFEFIFKLYGKFHAISFAYNKLHPQEFSEVAQGICNVFKKFSEKPSFDEVIKFTHQQVLDCLESEVDDAIIEKYKHYVDDGMEIFHRSLVIGKYSAILHGDCWSNNMMFKYDDSGKLVDMRFLDFQLMRVGSPVCDLSYCLYSGGTKDIFDELNHLLQVYHDSLSETLRAYGCNADQLYPLQALKDDWKAYCQLGLAMGLAIWRGKLVYDDEVVDLTDVVEEDDETMQKFKDAKFDEKTFVARVKDIILHMHENDYIS